MSGEIPPPGAARILASAVECMAVDGDEYEVRDHRVAQAEDQTKFACRLRYNSRNKFKASFDKAAINHWLNSSGMSIAAVAMEDTRGAESS